MNDVAGESRAAYAQRTAKRSRCSSCDAEIIWATTRSGRAMPVDAKPVADGNVILLYDRDGQLRAHVYKARPQNATGDEWHLAHHKTCPEGDQWRGKRRRMNRDSD